MIGRQSLLLSIVLSAVLIVSPLRLNSAQPPKSGGTLTVEEVVKMSQGGYSEELIVTRIKKHGKPFDLITEELDDLRKAGVTDNVIKFLLDPSQPYTPPPPRPSGPDPSAGAPAKSSGVPKQYPKDALAARVPAEAGLYFFQEGAPIKVDIKMLLGGVQGAGVGKVLKLKGKTIAYLVGPTSKTRIKEATPIFYLRLPEGKAIEEVLLVALEKKRDRREIDMGPPGPKPELKAGALRQFDSLEVGPRLFRLAAAKLAKGEYLFYFIGSAEPAKSNLGKGYDFGIEDLPQKPVK